jgi:cytochrome c1
VRGRVRRGSLTASAAAMTVVDARQFKNGRQMADWIGAVPRDTTAAAANSGSDASPRKATTMLNSEGRMAAVPGTVGRAHRFEWT